MSDSAGQSIGFKKISNYLTGIFISIVALPILIVTYPVSKWTRKLWISFAKWKYPRCIVVEQNTTRSVLDQMRNQGIYTLLVECQSISPISVRSHLIRLSSTKPLLTMALTTKCFLYAWETLEEFCIDNHLIAAPNSFKGRPITDNNIQDYVSDLTSKFLPNSLSPWQVHVISCQKSQGREIRYYLIRVHHHLLREEGLSIGDFLPLEKSAENWDHVNDIDSPFANLYSEPTALPKLHQKLTESFSNVWNEFLSNNDPIERPDILKKSISLWQCFKIAIIVGFSTVKEITRHHGRNQGLAFLRLFSILKRELGKRYLGWPVIKTALLNFVNPAEISRTSLLWIWYIIIILLLKSPILIYREMKAAVYFEQRHYYPDSLVSILSTYLPLIYGASLEIIAILSISLSAPFAIFDVFIKAYSQPKAARLQALSQSGRKVVSWSDEIEMSFLQRIADIAGVTYTEVLLAAVSDSIKEYFEEAGRPVPAEILSFAKCISQKSLYGKDRQHRGLLCFSLPVKSSSVFQQDLLEILQTVEANVRETRENQRAIYAITKADAASGILISWIPSVFLKVVLNHLTSKYSISLTHVDGDLPVDRVNTAVFWKPPQGNCSLSMTLHRHGRAVRLAIMADAVISPNHTIITKNFPKSLRRLADTLGVLDSPDRNFNSLPTTVLPPGH